RLRGLVNCGRFDPATPEVHALLGTNARLTELQGALLDSQLDRLEAQSARREERAHSLDRLLGQIPGIQPQTPHPHQPRGGYHLYGFRYRSDAFGERSRDQFVQALVAEGIPASSGYRLPVHRQPLFTSGLAPARRRATAVIEAASMDLPVTDAVC